MPEAQIAMCLDRSQAAGLAEVECRLEFVYHGAPELTRATETFRHD